MRCAARSRRLVVRTMPLAGDLAIPRAARLSNPDGTTLAELTGLPYQRLDLTGHLQIVFLRRLGSTNPGIIYEIEFSSDAGNWAVNPGATVSTLAIDAIWERVTVTDSDVLPLRLARLRVTTIP